MSQQQPTTEEVIRRLQKHGVNPTRQRIDVARVLFARPQHLSAEEILHSTRKLGARISKATVYNTLALFSSKGLVREIIVDPSRVFYDSNPTAHHHFYNIDTGELLDFDATQLQLRNMPHLPPGTVADGVDVVIRIRNASLQ
ncbi:MAG TPA: transcriptional repressor [Gammaproteobacteria bacterium]|nr:transcriptional repressor [Gammaproteobacteria bacterium]